MWFNLYLAKTGDGQLFMDRNLSTGNGDVFREEARKQKAEDKIEVIESDPSLTGVDENRIDIAIFRGAFFFPSLFEVNFSAIFRVLRRDGIAFIGGGFGKFTPETVIKKIGKRSRDLKLKIGKK